jgi:hypothetical protein
MKFKFAALFLATITAIVAGAYRLQPLFSAPPSPESEDFAPPLDLNDQKFFKQPKEPTFKPNKGASPEKLLKKEAAIAKHGKKAKLKSAELKTFGDFDKKNLKGMKNDDISPDRMVWEVESQFSDGVEINGAKYINPVVTTAVDAETGEILWLKVSSAEMEGRKNPKEKKEKAP